jgi:hypothetical protein
MVATIILGKGAPIYRSDVVGEHATPSSALAPARAAAKDALISAMSADVSTTLSSVGDGNLAVASLIGTNGVFTKSLPKWTCFLAPAFAVGTVSETEKMIG